MAYIECPSCGKTALSVASRCPHCGLLFSAGVIPPAEPSRRPHPWIVAGALVGLMALVAVGRNMMETPAAPPPPAPTATAPTATTPAVRQPEPPVDGLAPPSPVQPPAPVPDSAVDSSPPPAAAPPPAEPVQSAPVKAATAPAAPAGDQVQRFATTWVNVRDRRGPSAAPVRVLEPGEAILVDSLIGGWYRVVVGGQAIGYAYGSNLSESAP